MEAELLKLKALLFQLMKEGKIYIDPAHMDDVIYACESIYKEGLAVAEGYITMNERLNLLSLENAKLIEKLERAENLGFK